MNQYQGTLFLSHLSPQLRGLIEKREVPYEESVAIARAWYDAQLITKRREYGETQKK